MAVQIKKFEGSFTYLVYKRDQEHPVKDANDFGDHLRNLSASHLSDDKDIVVYIGNKTISRSEQTYLADALKNVQEGEHSRCLRIIADDGVRRTYLRKLEGQKNIAMYDSLDSFILHYKKPIKN